MQSLIRGIMDQAPVLRPISGSFSTVSDDNTVVFKGSVHVGDVAHMREYMKSVASQLKPR